MQVLYLKGNNMRHITISGLFVLSLFCTANGQSKVALRVPMSPGKYVMVQETSMTTTTQMDQFPQPIVQSMQMLVEMATEVSPTNDSGEYTIKARFTRIKQSIGDDMSYDSQNEADSSSPLAILGSMLDSEITITMSKNQDIVDIAGMDKIWDKMAQNPQIAPMMAQLKESFGDNMLKGLVSQGNKSLPYHEVAVGESWQQKTKMPIPFVGRAEIQYDGTLSSYDADAKQAKIAFTSEMVSSGEEKKMNMGIPATVKDMKMTQKGVTNVDLSTGIANTDMDQVMSMTMVISSPQGDQKVTVSQEGSVTATISKVE